MTRWKSKVTLVDLGDMGREHHVVVALYGDDKMPIMRHEVHFGEFCTPAEVACVLRQLADKVEGKTKYSERDE